MDVLLLTFDEQNMSEYGNPNKKMRLDFRGNSSKNFNEELWGDEDITADDFDMATQSCQNNVIYPHNAEINLSESAYISADNLPNTSTNQDESFQQLQYELEGKVKILSHTVDELSKELKDEKLNRDKIITEKIKQYEEKEEQLQIKLRKMESVLQFKDQEMRSVYDKLHPTKSHTDNKIPEPEVFRSKSPKKFIKRLDFGNDALAAQKLPEKSSCPQLHRKHKLALYTPLGKPQQIDIISSVLCNKLTVPTQNFIEASNSSCVCTSNPSYLSTFSVVHTRLEEQVSELLNHCCHILESYLTQLRSHTPNEQEKNVSLVQISNKEESPSDHTLSISALRDVAFLVSCSEFKSVIEKWEQENGALSNSPLEIPDSSSSSSSSRSEGSKRIHPLLQILLKLTNASQYHFQWALSALVTWSSSSVEYLGRIADALPIHSLLKSCFDPTSLLLCLKFISKLCVCKEFKEVLVHKNDCLICTIGDILCRKIPKSMSSEYIDVMVVIEDFLSAVFSIYSSSDLSFESSPCLTKVASGLIISLWWFFEKCITNSAVTRVLKRGLLLLHFLSRYIRNFKEKRSEVENVYISLVCGLLTLSKENPIYKDLFDLIPELWDFQEDASELDVDEKSEDGLCQSADCQSE